MNRKNRAKKRIPLWFRRRNQEPRVEIVWEETQAAPKPESNAGKPDAARYIEKCRKMDAEGRLCELINVRQKWEGSILANVPDLMEYYSDVHAWLANIVSFELNEAETERPDIFGFCPPPNNYTTNSTW